MTFLIHGSGMNEYDWAPVLKPMEEAGLNAVTFVWRGHSRSLPFDKEKFAGTGLFDYVEDAQTVLDKYKAELGLADEQITIAGHSYGTIINSYLARNKNYKSILNFCAGYPNEEFFKSNGVDIKNKNQLTKSLGGLWNFASDEYIKATLEEAGQGECLSNYRENGTLESHVRQLFNVEVPDNYNGSLEKLLGPYSRKAVAEALLDPPFLPKRAEINSPMHFFSATEDKMVSGETIKKMADAWQGSYQELPGPHVITYSPYLNEVIAEIKKHAG